MTPAGTSILVGIAASPGIAIGRCWSLDRRRIRTPKRRLAGDEVDVELQRFRNALEVSDLQLSEVGFGVWTLTTGWWGEHGEDEHGVELHHVAQDLGKDDARADEVDDDDADDDLHAQDDRAALLHQGHDADGDAPEERPEHRDEARHEHDGGQEDLALDLEHVQQDPGEERRDDGEDGLVMEKKLR